ncbi:olfactory receptor-like protein COR9 [Tachyglossus aculeatus]|uniref:olfactory receptor-like protein COR9 n=1 Tax=Tachyglossus aculeatus TaxID=9261 RepID=UPI0018F5E1DE|nr:olfactory receptor-like protein COR9 [Tachyglossus aculeatus]
MAFDHYVAICSPLLYMVVFEKQSEKCLQTSDIQENSSTRKDMKRTLLQSIALKMLAVFFLEVRTISLIECTIQIYHFVACVTIEGYLLVVMAYDCFTAICNPLVYTVVMSPRVCTQLILCSYLIGFLQGLIQVLLIFHLPFCKSNIINHFFCDLSPILKLLCSNTFPSEVLLFSLGLFNGTVTSLEIVVYYVYILITTLKIRSATGRCKAFSTCVSHLTVVGSLYGTTIFIYIRPSSQYTPENDKVGFHVFILL